LAAKENWQASAKPLPQQVLPTDFFALSPEPFPRMFHEPSWIWNQTNSKIYVSDLDTGGELVLQKLNARKRRGFPRAPSYKVWQYTFEQKIEPMKLHGLWCEKGLEDNNPQTLHNPNAPMDPNFSYNPSTSIATIPTIQQVKEYRKESTRKRESNSANLPEPPQKFLKPSTEIYQSDTQFSFVQEDNNPPMPSQANNPMLSVQISSGVPTEQSNINQSGALPMQSVVVTDNSNSNGNSSLTSNFSDTSVSQLSSLPYSNTTISLFQQQSPVLPNQFTQPEQPPKWFHLSSSASSSEPNTTTASQTLTPNDTYESPNS